MTVDKCASKITIGIVKDCKTVIKAKDIKKRVFGDSDYIGVLYKDGEKGFVFKKSLNEYSVVQIGNNGYLEHMFYETIDKCLNTTDEISKVVVFYERKDLVKWMGKEK